VQALGCNLQLPQQRSEPTTAATYVMSPRSLMAEASFSKSAASDAACIAVLESKPCLREEHAAAAP
jgi:hypothetical protein